MYQNVEDHTLLHAENCQSNGYDDRPTIAQRGTTLKLRILLLTRSQNYISVEWKWSSGNELCDYHG